MISNSIIFLFSPAAKSQDTGFVARQVIPHTFPVKNLRLPTTMFKDSALKNSWQSYPGIVLPKFSKPFISIGRGSIDYSFYYRSQIDTPFFQTNVYQHQMSGTVNMMIGNFLPFKVSSLIRRTNSFQFRDITDVQVAFDVQAFQQKIYTNSLKNIDRIAEQFKDSLSGQLAALKTIEYFKLNNQFKNFFTIQKLVEANELLNVSALSWDKTLPDSSAKIKSDSLRNKASAFIKRYNESKVKIDSLKKVVDSVKSVYENSLTTVRNIRQLSEGKINSYDQFQKLSNSPEIKKRGIELIPAKYKWMMGVKKFIVGRSFLNYSDLTVKNNSLKGINFEYNSWYYAAFSAGLLDFRFRDFVISNPDRYKQYFYMGRIGIGQLNRNFVIVSLFNGTKQIFAAGAVNKVYRFNITGLSVEAKYQFSRNGYVKMEVAESVAPDFRQLPLKKNSWNLNDKNDKAYSLAAHLNIPKFRTSLDAAYKYTGANFQSFSTFQTTSSLNVYHIKWEQYLLRKKLRITAAIRSNEFTNPYLLQQYSNNTVSKSIQAVFRKNKWPVLSAAYTPLSQLTKVGEVIYENRYDAFNATVYHVYNIGGLKAMSTIMFAQFYNNSRDSGFIYFNAKNIVFNQQFYSRHFTNALSISRSSNSNYEFTVVDESVQRTFKGSGSVAVGFKIHALNKQTTKPGYYFRYRLPVNATLSFSLLYEQGFIPGIKGTLVKNDIGNIQLSKSF